MDTALVIGGDGFLGQFVNTTLLAHGVPVFSTSRRSATAQIKWTLDLADLASRTELAALAERSLVTHAFVCAAIGDVDFCRENPALSENINVIGTRDLLSQLLRRGITPVFFSSDYVFSGAIEKPREEAVRQPRTVYGRQKSVIESFLEGQSAPFVVFRTSKLFSLRPHVRNPLTQIVRQIEAGNCRAVTDQWVTPVFLEDLTECLMAACHSRLRGFYHLACERVFSRYEIACWVAERLGFAKEIVRPGRLEELKLLEARPHLSTLNSERIRQELPIRFRDVYDVSEEIVLR